MILAPDADILGIIQRVRHLQTLTKCGLTTMVVTDVVWDEVTVNAAANGASAATVAEMDNALTVLAGARTVIAPMTPESKTFTLLATPPVREGPGELSVIAYALHHDDVWPVLHDRAAMLRAVEELRGRVLSLHGFLGAFHKDFGLSKVDATAISQAYCSRYTPTRPPLWW